MRDIRVLIDCPRLLSYVPRTLTPRHCLDGQDLLGDHTEHLKLNPVEFVKACPCTRTGQSFEKFPHRQVVKAVTAVENDAEHSQGFGQVFDLPRFV